MFTVGGAHIIVEVIYIIHDVILFSSNRSQTKNQIDFLLGINIFKG